MVLEVNPENIDHQDSQGRTSLLWAAYKNADVKVLEELIGHEADCTIKVIEICTTKFERNINVRLKASLFFDKYLSGYSFRLFCRFVVYKN